MQAEDFLKLLVSDIVVVPCFANLSCWTKAVIHPRCHRQQVFDGKFCFIPWAKICPLRVDVMIHVIHDLQQILLLGHTNHDCNHALLYSKDINRRIAENFIDERFAVHCYMNLRATRLLAIVFEFGNWHR